MDLIDRTELVNLLETAIAITKSLMKLLDAEDDPEFNMEIKSYTDILDGVKDMPSACPEAVKSKQEHAEEFLKWLAAYQQKALELQGRYTPYEVIGWAVNDFRREFPERAEEP